MVIAGLIITIIIQIGIIVMLIREWRLRRDSWLWLLLAGAVLLAAISSTLTVAGQANSSFAPSGATLAAVFSALTWAGLAAVTVLFINYGSRLLESQNLQEDAIQRLTTILDSLNAMVYVADMESYEILTMNANARSIWNGSSQQVTSLDELYSTIGAPTDPSQQEVQLTPEGEPGEPITWEFEDTRTGKWYMCHNRAVRWPDGRLVRLEIAIETTERRRELASLQASERLYRLLVETMQDGLAILDLDGQFTYVNHRLCAILGLPAREVVGQRATNYVNNTSFNRLRVQLAKHWQGNDHNHSIIWCQPDGVEVETIVSGAPVRDAAGEINGSFLIATDITERKRMEAVEREMERNAAEIEILRKTTATYAHEINNPLTGIVANLQMLESEKLCADTGEMLGDALVACKRIKEVIETMEQIDTPRYRDYIGGRQIIDIRTKNS